MPCMLKFVVCSLWMYCIAPKNRIRSNRQWRAMHANWTCYWSGCIYLVHRRPVYGTFGCSFQWLPNNGLVIFFAVFVRFLGDGFGNIWEAIMMNLFASGKVAIVRLQRTTLHSRFPAKLLFPPSLHSLDLKHWADSHLSPSMLLLQIWRSFWGWWCCSLCPLTWMFSLRLGCSSGRTPKKVEGWSVYITLSNFGASSKAPSKGLTLGSPIFDPRKSNLGALFKDFVGSVSPPPF